MATSLFVTALYDTIVVGTDGSDAAETALRHAGELAKATGTSTIHVVVASRRVERAEVHMALEEVPDVFGAEPDLHAGDRHVLEEAGKMMQGYGIPVTTHLVKDAPADALITVAEQTNADLIVVGSRGLGAGARLFLGSVSTKVVHHAHDICTVLVVNCDG